MKFVVRVFGTWMIVLALILLVIDGTKSLAANQPVMTSVASLWQSLDPGSWAALKALVTTYLAPFAADGLAYGALSIPAWALSGGIGLVALFMGRKRRKPVYADPL